MSKKKEKKDRPEQPAEPKEPAEPKPTTEPETPAEPKEDKRRGPGRPPGARNTPKSTTAPRKRRKAPAEYKDTGAALKGLAGDFNVVAKEHNRLHPKDPVELVEIRKRGTGKRKPKIPASVCEGVIVTSTTVLANMWKVEDTRPDEKAVKECARAWEEASGYLEDIDPKWVAFGAAGFSTFMLVYPMYQEKRARQDGTWVSPAAELPPHKREPREEKP